MRDKLYLVLEDHLIFLENVARDYGENRGVNFTKISLIKANILCRKNKIPEVALGYYVIDEDGNPKCLSFNGNE